MKANVLAAAWALLLVSVPVFAQESIRLADTIKSGVGDINAFDGQGKAVITATQIEALRIDNNGYVVLGVDINEAASGTEKAETQGVTVESVALTALINGEVKTYTEFKTQTQSIVAKAGSENRESYYTLIGATGSNAITGSKIDGSGYDSTLAIRVDDALDMASAITIAIRFLDTNVSLGDPEAFYDYSAGFEDLALINASDKFFLDEQAAGRDGAPLVVLTETVTDTVASFYSPSATDYYIVAYEDEFPNKGDYDLNDLVVAYRVTFGLDAEGLVKTIEGNGYLIARGGLYDHDWHLRIPFNVSTQSAGEFALYSPPEADLSFDRIDAIDVSEDLDIKVFSNTTTLFTDPLAPFVNTLPESDQIRGEKFTFTITLANAIALSDIGPAPFDPYLVVNSTGYEVHLPGNSAVNQNSNNILRNKDVYVDENGYPFAHIFPEGWKNPLERVDIGSAYPNLLDFVNSGKKEHVYWYLRGVDGLLAPTDITHWKWQLPKTQTCKPILTC